MFIVSNLKKKPHKKILHFRYLNNTYLSKSKALPSLIRNQRWKCLVKYQKLKLLRCKVYFNKSCVTRSLNFKRNDWLWYSSSKFGNWPNPAETKLSKTWFDNTTIPLFFSLKFTTASILALKMTKSQNLLFKPTLIVLSKRKKKT